MVHCQPVPDGPMTRAATIQLPSGRDAASNAIAVLGSLILNGLMLLLVAVWTLLPHPSRPAPRPDEPDEVVIRLEELLPALLPDSEKPEKLAYAETFADQTSDRPLAPSFESDRNTRGATEVVPDKPSEAPVPTQKGLDRIDVLVTREHRYLDAPDGEIPKSAPAPPGMTVPPDMARPPESEAEPEPMAEPAPPAPEGAEEPPDQAEPQESRMVAEARDGEAETAEPTEAEPGKAGGTPETLEMAKLDLPKEREAFSDALDVMDEKTAEPDVDDAMPERAPTVVDATEPWFQMPRVRPSAPLVARPLARPESTPSVTAPPGARPSPEAMGQADMAAFSPERRLNAMNGSLSNQGKSAVDAEATPVGAYKSKVARAVERRWHELRVKNASFVSFGSLKVRFLVNRNGHVSGIRVVHQDAGAVLTDFSLAAIASAAIPPMPPEVAEAFGSEPLEVTYDILIY